MYTQTKGGMGMNREMEIQELKIAVQQTGDR
jgi:hypothetical protein